MKNILLLSCFFYFFTLSASHILNSRITAELKDTTNDGKLLYRIRLTAERVCESGSITFPNDFLIGVYRKKDAKLEQELTANLVGKLTKTDCYGICIEEAVYETNLLVPKSNEGYEIITLYCCRTEMKSLPNDQNGFPYQGSMPYTFVSGSVLPSMLTSTIPSIIFMDPVSTYTLNYDIENSSADSMTIERMTPLVGANLSQSFPIMPPNFPGFNNVTYNQGYANYIPFGMNSVYTIDQQNKTITLKGNTTGNYVIAYQIKSFLKGKLIHVAHSEIFVFISNTPVQVKPIKMNGWVDLNKTGIVNWSSCSVKADRYILEKSEVNTTGFNAIDTYSYYQTHYYDKLLSAGKEYFYRIRAERNNKADIFSDTLRLFYWNSSIEGISEDKNGITVYPQPGNNLISVEFRDQNIASLRIFELNGKTVMETIFSGMNKLEHIDISGLAPGIYYMLVIGSNNEQVRVQCIRE